MKIGKTLLFSWIAFSIPAISMVFADGSSRKPIQAETEFIKSVMRAFAQAVPPGPTGWESGGGSTDPAERVVYTEVNEPLRIDYLIEWRDSKRIREADAQLIEEMTKLAKKPGFRGEGIDELTKKLAPQDVQVKISIGANKEFPDFYRDVKPVSPIAGGLVYRSQAEYSSGRGVDEGSTYVLLGRGWNTSKGAGYAKFTLSKANASSMVIQNIVVQVQAASGRAEGILQAINWKALSALIK